MFYTNIETRQNKILSVISVAGGFASAKLPFLLKQVANKSWQANFLLVLNLGRIRERFKGKVLAGTAELGGRMSG